MLRRAAVLGIALMLMAGLIRVTLQAGGDVANHLEFGARFANRAPIYDGGLNFVYPPFWAMAFAPLSLLPPWLAKCLLYCVGAAALLALLRSLRRLARRDAHAWLWTACVGIAVCAPPLHRDQADCLLNTSLMALTWLGIEQWRLLRPWRGGALIGLATALKCTPGVFLPYFLWKRQWRMAAATAGFALLFTVAPAAWQGWATYRTDLQHWLGAVQAAARRVDPSQGMLGTVVPGRESEGVVYEDKVGNLALKPALARYLMHLPYLHLGRAETSDSPARAHDAPSPWHVQFLDMSPAAAGLLARLIMLVLLVAVFATFSRSTGSEMTMQECAAVSLLMLLLSPLTWVQHCVWILPAACLLAGHALGGAKWTRAALLFCFAAFLLSGKDLFGRGAVNMLDSYHVKTAAMLCMLAAVLLVGRSGLSAGMRGPGRGKADEAA